MRPRVDTILLLFLDPWLREVPLKIKNELFPTVLGGVPPDTQALPLLRVREVYHPTPNRAEFVHISNLMTLLGSAERAGTLVICSARGGTIQLFRYTDECTVFVFFLCLSILPCEITSVR